MAQKIRVGAVSYLNTKPLIYGFEQGMMKEEIDLVIDYPAAIAKQLLNNEIDVGLVPVAIIPELAEHYIISDYCIGCDGEVASVCLFSDVPVEEIKTLLLDYQSRTSVELLKILLKEHWKISPELMQSTAGYETLIKGDTAALIIGDRALQLYSSTKYRYDLGTAWKILTGLPFVFAAWVSNKKLPADLINNFNKSNATGLSAIGEIVSSLQGRSSYNLADYYNNNIQYDLDAEKKKALALFFDKLALPVELPQ